VLRGPGAVRCGAVRCGAVRCGAVRCGAVRCGAVRYVVFRCRDSEGHTSHVQGCTTSFTHTHNNSDQHESCHRVETRISAVWCVTLWCGVLRCGAM